MTGKERGEEKSGEEKRRREGRTEKKSLVVEPGKKRKLSGHTELLQRQLRASSRSTL